MHGILNQRSSLKANERAVDQELTQKQPLAMSKFLFSGHPETTQS
jgi:hypothetical protein